MSNTPFYPSDNDIKQDLAFNTTKYAVESFIHGFSLGCNYQNIRNANFELDKLYADLDRVIWYIRGRYIYGLPIIQQDIDVAKQIQSLIEQKQAEKRDSKQQMWASGISLAFLIGGGILSAIASSDNKK